MSSPEIYHFTSTSYVPNSPLPTLVYRQCLPSSVTEENAHETIESNHWLKGGVFKHYPAHHFHPNTHECYAVFKGSSRLLLGRGPLDSREGGAEVTLSAGDIIVLPAGTCHCCLESTEDYEYLGLYPEGSPKWLNRFAKKEEEKEESETMTKDVPVPEWDPVFGKDGPLCRIWSKKS